jgi:hypothetical protein
MIKTNAFDGVIAGVLSQQYTNEQWYSVAYFFKTIVPAEYNYGIHNKEVLAIVRSLD